MNVRPVVRASVVAFVVATANAQTVRLRLIDSSDHPVVGALVSLRDSSRASRFATVSDRGGLALLETLVPGRYTVDVRRVGFSVFASDAVSLHSNETVPLVLRIVGGRVPLDSGQTVTRDCAIAGTDLEVLPAWSAIRLALESAQLGRGLVAGQWHIRRFERWTNASGDIYHDTTFFGRSDRPFGTPNSERLERDGYVRVRRDGTSDYFVPDTRVILSEQFTQNHCFGAQVSDSIPALLGVRFAPIRGRNQPDISGTFWLNRSTGELQTLDFAYVNVPNQPNGRASGRVRFHHDEPGFWMVQSWKLRVPHMSALDEPGYPLVFSGWFETGAEAVP